MTHKLGEKITPVIGKVHNVFLNSFKGFLKSFSQSLKTKKKCNFRQSVHQKLQYIQSNEKLSCFKSRFKQVRFIKDSIQKQTLKKSHHMIQH